MGTASFLWGQTLADAYFANTTVVLNPSTGSTSYRPGQAGSFGASVTTNDVQPGDLIWARVLSRLTSSTTQPTITMPSGWTKQLEFTDGLYRTQFWSRTDPLTTSVFADVNSAVTFTGAGSSSVAMRLEVMLFSVRGGKIADEPVLELIPLTGQNPLAPTQTTPTAGTLAIGWMYGFSGQLYPNGYGPQNGWELSGFTNGIYSRYNAFCGNLLTPAPAPEFQNFASGPTACWLTFSIADATSGWSVGRIKY